MKIKFCGLTRQEDIAAVNALSPDYVGFVFAESRRKISAETAKRWKEMLCPRIKTVGVFVNESLENIVGLVKNGIIDVVQLHGDEDEAYIRFLKSQVDVAIIRAVRVQSHEQIKEMEKLPVDFLLLDTYQKDSYGGSGIAFDWSVISDIKKPFFLAGGINQENIKEALATGAYALDISSGIETNGMKDKHKMDEIMHMVRSYGNE